MTLSTSAEFRLCCGSDGFYRRFFFFLNFISVSAETITRTWFSVRFLPPGLAWPCAYDEFPFFFFFFFWCVRVQNAPLINPRGAAINETATGRPYASEKLDRTRPCSGDAVRSQPYTMDALIIYATNDFQTVLPEYNIR